MNTTHAEARRLPYALNDGLQTFGSLAILPLFPSDAASLEYIGLDEAAARGLVVTEIDEAGVVGALAVANPLDEHVLLFEGEELVGAKQNRILGRPILAGAHSKLSVPVACVERGRWAYKTRSFDTAPRAAYPELRKAQRSGQGAVWEEVAAKQLRMSAFSPTDAAESLYVSNEDSLAEHVAAFPRLDGQSGALVAIGGRVACLDYVGRPEAWAGLHAKLVRGYALQALEAPAAEVRVKGLARLLGSYNEAKRQPREHVGLGECLDLHGAAVGTDLTHNGELVALSLFPGDAA